MLFIVLLGIFISHYLSQCKQLTDPIAATRSGRYRGSSMLSTAGREFHAFRGIRYAQPPVGDLRFNDPVAVEPFTDLFDATKEGPTCIQNDAFSHRIKGSEDCLALNVYTHSLATDKPKPVLVWIHGRGWFSGSGNGETDFHGPHHFMDHDVVLVTINYRLGPFGFLSTEDDVAPGNYGLLDQTMALTWVRDNVEFFGGSSSSITIAGQSVGAASVQYHVLSERSKGLFHRAIMQSGSSLCLWAAPFHQGQATRLLADKSKCPTAESRDLIRCLRSRTVEEILSNVTNYSELNAPVLTFGPRLDIERRPPFLPRKPIDSIKNGALNQVPLIIGVNRNESAFFLTFFMNQMGQLKSQFKENPEKHIADLLTGEMKDSTLVQQAMDVYLDRTKPLDQQINSLEQMLSDGQFLKCIDDAVVLQGFYSQQPTYYYVYSHRGQHSLATLFNAAATNLGVSHADEILLMFSNKVIPPSSSEMDKKIGNTLVQLWTSFAYEGEPRSDLLAFKWPPIDCRHSRYLKIDANPMIVDAEFTYRGRLWFWDTKNLSSSAVNAMSVG